MATASKKTVTKWEPTSNFYFRSAICSLEDLQDCLNNLRVECTKKKDSLSLSSEHINAELSVHCGVFSSGHSAEYIIRLCEYWKLQEETKYMALEIFSRFMSKLVCQLRDMIFGKSLVEKKKPSTSQVGSAISPVDQKIHLEWMADENGSSMSGMADEEWKKTLGHIKGQMKLRAVTSVMIASKATTHGQIVTVSMTLEFLLREGLSYSGNVMIKSERRILKAIDYDVRRSVSLHPYVMILLEVLCRGEDRFNGAKIYPVCIQLLDLFYCSRTVVLGSIFDVRVSESWVLEFENEQQVSRFLESSCDLVRISAVLVSAAAYIVDKPLSDTVINHLSELIEFDERLLTRAACALLKALLF